MANAEGGLVDFFLKIDGIQGESTDHKHKNEIDIHSWSWNQYQGGVDTTSGLAAGKVQFDPFYFTMHINKASPALFLACAQGDHIKEALLTCRKAGKEQQEYLKIKFSDLIISGYKTGREVGEKTYPIDQIAINFTKIEMTYSPQKADGKLDSPVVKNYDIRSQKGG
jgi:type VI secretion system secreted protein Hcp